MMLQNLLLEQGHGEVQTLLEIVAKGAEVQEGNRLPAALPSLMVFAVSLKAPAPGVLGLWENLSFGLKQIKSQFLACGCGMEL